jgi:hypothetical protein
VKVRSGFFLGRKRRSFVGQPKTLFQPFERTSIGSSGSELRSCMTQGSFGRFRCLRGATFLR